MGRRRQRTCNRCNQQQEAVKIGEEIQEKQDCIQIEKEKKAKLEDPEVDQKKKEIQENEYLLEQKKETKNQQEKNKKEVEIQELEIKKLRTKRRKDIQPFYIEKYVESFEIKRTLGSTVIIPFSTDPGTIYQPANLIFKKKKGNQQVVLTYSGNIHSFSGMISLEFQIFRRDFRQLYSVNVGPAWKYKRESISSETNTFSFSVEDEMLEACQERVYYVQITVSELPTIGMAMVTNSILDTVISTI